MSYSKSLFTLFISTGLSYAATLSVYQDKTFYTYAPSSHFIGLTQHIAAKCEGEYYRCWYHVRLPHRTKTLQRSKGT